MKHYHTISLDCRTATIVERALDIFTGNINEIREIKETLQIIMSTQEQFDRDIQQIKADAQAAKDGYAAVVAASTEERAQVQTALTLLSEQITVLQGRLIDTGALQEVKNILSGAAEARDAALANVAGIFVPPTPEPAPPTDPVPPVDSVPPTNPVEPAPPAEPETPVDPVPPTDPEEPQS